MASSLQGSTVVSSISVGGNTVWHAGNDGRGSSLNVQNLWNYNLNHLNVRSRTTALSTITDPSGNAVSNAGYYPMLFNQSGWGSGIMELSIRKSSVHQGGGGAGCLYGRFRYRTTQWGHHSTFWEMEDNWGGGFNYPYIAGMASNGQNNQSVIWLRGNTQYYYMFDNASDAFYDVTVQGPKTQTESNGATNTRNVLASADVFVPSNARYYQKHIHPKANNAYNLGDSSYRWSTVFATAENNTSDMRLKENFGVTLGTEFLRKLKPRTYIRRAPYMLPEDLENDPRKLYPDDQRRTIGFIAQEVKQVMEEMGIAEEDFAAFDGRDSNHLSLLYSEFVPILIKTLQEKQERIVQIRSRIEKLENN